MMKKDFKKRFIAEIPSEFASQENFHDLFSQNIQQEIKAGTVIKGRVVGVDRDVVIVDVKLKNEGRIPVSEFELASDMSLPKIGDLVDVYVEKVEGRNGHTVLSREKALREESWLALEQAQVEGLLVDGVIFGKVKGGFTVDLSGVVAFLPGSQVDVQPVKNMSALMNIVQQFQILKMDKKLGNIVVSRRAILEESRAEAREEMLSKIHVGMVLDGIVKNIVHYGAFIELAIGDNKLYLDGLLHVTDILWRRINHPSEVLSIGQEVKVMVIKFNRESERISLGMKQLDSNPWDVIDDKFKVGDLRVGKVKSIADYGVFIEITEEMEGLCHTSEISWNKANQNPKKALTIGQDVVFKILDIDKEKYRISLSLKQSQPNPWEVLVKNYPVGTMIKAPIRNIADFGMFVALSVTTDPVKYQINGKEYQVDGATYLIDGMIHASDISWHSTGEDLLKNYNKGDEIECKVIAVDSDKERISLGIKQLTKNVYNDIQEGQEVEATITEVYKEGIQVSLENDISGFIKRVDLSSDRTKQKPESFEIGGTIKAKIINIDKANRSISLSVKALEIAEQDRLMREYGASSNDSSANLGDAIGDALLQVSDQVSKHNQATKERQHNDSVAESQSDNDIDK